jgi:protein O-mannosyl-transferase
MNATRKKPATVQDAGGSIRMKRIRNVTYYLATAVGLITFVIYLRALQNGFVAWDDNTYIVDNFDIRSFDLGFLKSAFFGFTAGNWHPLTWVSHAADYAIWGLNPLGHHLTSIILHSLNTYLVVILSIKLLEPWNASEVKQKSASAGYSQTVLVMGGVAGLLFGLHPLHVESVAWVAERKDVLCAFFFLLSILRYLDYGRGIIRKAGFKEPFLRSINCHYFITLGFFILAVLSKPMAITLPIVLLLLDWYPLQRIASLKNFQAVCVEKLPFFVVSMISAVLTVLAQRAGKAIVPTEFIPLSARFFVAAHSLLAYLWKMVIPLSLSPFYPYPKNLSLLSWEYVSSIVLIIGITLTCIVWAKKQKLWLTVWGYYVVTLIPVLGVVQVGGQAMADRYTYLPSIGPFLIIGILAGLAWEKVTRVTKWRFLFRLLGASVILCVFFVLAYLTFTQIGIWKNSIDLWSYVLKEEPEKVPLAFNQRGIAFYDMGQLDSAGKDFERAIALNPSYIDAHNNFGMTLYKMGRLDDAIGEFDKAIALNTSYREAYNNRGMAFNDKGQLDRAIEDFKMAIALYPSYYKAYANMGMSYGKAHLYDQALESFTKSIAISPNSADAYYNRGLTYVFMGQSEGALEDFNKAIELNNKFGVAYINRGRLYLKAGRKDLAVLDLQKACELGYKAGCDALHDATRD